MTPIRVLLVEDEPAHATLVRRYLAAASERDFDVEWVEQLAAGLDRLGNGAYDVVLLDLGLPDSDPRTTLQRVLEATDLPVVVLTTSESRDEAIAAVKAGAQDHLPKPRVNGELLARSLFYSIERKRSERELSEFNEMLEQRVAERSAVAERRARMLRRLAVDLSQTERRERRRLAQLLHDDLQQLIVAARMRLETLVGGLQPGRERQTVEHTVGLLKQSIDVSRSLTLDLFPPVLQERGLGAALEWLGRRMEEQHDLDVTVTVAGEPDRFDDDMASLLLDAARELLFNVVKHAGVDAAGVTLDCTGQATGRLTVHDEGKGFDPAVLQQQVSDRFGLFSIQERLETVGGGFEAHSVPGAGSTVRLEAPYDAGKAAAGEPVRRPTSPVPVARRRGSEVRPAGAGERIRVLVVDDHEIVRHGLVTAIAAQPDLAVIGEASNGLGALEALQKTAADVVVMDVSMPGMDGIEATRRIQEGWPGVRVIGLSMHDPADMATTMTGAGAATYLSKSAGIERLIEAIRANRRSRSAD